MRDLLEEKRPRLPVEHRTSEVSFSDPLKQLMRDLLGEKTPRFPVDHKTRTSEVRFSDPLNKTCNSTPWCRVKVRRLCRFRTGGEQKIFSLLLYFT